MTTIIDTVYDRYDKSWIPLYTYRHAVTMSPSDMLHLTVCEIVPHDCTWKIPSVDDHEVLVEWIDGDYKRSKLIIGG